MVALKISVWPPISKDRTKTMHNISQPKQNNVAASSTLKAGLDLF